MASADVAVFKNEFKSTGVTIIFLPALEVIQLLVQEIFYYLNPVPGYSRVAWAWAVFAIATVAALFTAIILNFGFACNKARRSTRMFVLFLWFLIPVMLLQPALQESFFYVWPGDYPDKSRLLAMGIGSLISLVLGAVLCWIFCAHCDCLWERLAGFFYARLPNETA